MCAQWLFRQGSEWKRTHALKVARCAVALVVGSAIGSLLGMLSAGLSGAGHGSVIPAAIYLGAAAELCDPELWHYAGAVAYAVYGAILVAGTNWVHRTKAYSFIMICHATSVFTIVVWWWPGVSWEVLKRLARCWHYQPWALPGSAVLFLLANWLAHGLPKRIGAFPEGAIDEGPPRLPRETGNPYQT